MYQVIIPNYIRTVELSKKQIPKYYRYDGITIKGAGKKLLVKYTNPGSRMKIGHTGIVEPDQIADNYYLGIYKGNKQVDTVRAFPITGRGKRVHEYMQTHKVFLVNKETNERVLANNTQAGTPKVYTINGQDFYSGNLNPFARRKVMQAIKESYIPHIKTLPVIEKPFPYRVQLTIFDTPKLTTDRVLDELSISQFWDVGNRAFPYAKAFLDLLATGKTGKKANNEYVQYFEPKLPDDNIMFITQDPCGARFIPVDDESQRKLVFSIIPDTNALVLGNQFYKEFHNY